MKLETTDITIAEDPSFASCKYESQKDDYGLDEYKMVYKVSIKGEHRGYIYLYYRFGEVDRIERGQRLKGGERFVNGYYYGPTKKPYTSLDSWEKTPLYFLSKDIIPRSPGDNWEKYADMLRPHIIELLSSAEE